MTRFVQRLPEPADPYTGDPLLREWLRHALGGEDPAAAARLRALAGEVAGPLREAHREAEAHPPRLVRYDAWGGRVDRIETAAGWRTLRAAAARHALVALPYLPGPRAQWGDRARVVQHALLHLYGPESATFSCPVAMSDGTAALLGHPEVDPAVAGAWLPRLTSTDPGLIVHSGQWMTESSGGSDLSRAATTAHPEGTGGWRLTGEKWFCSAIDAELAVVLARPAGAGAGSRVLAPFLVERDQPGAAGSDPAGPRIVVHRLKDKLGTRALPTAEVGLRAVAAVPLGDPDRPGLARMMTLVRVARLHNAAAAAAGMRRGLAYARAFAAARQAGGRPLREQPLHRATLGVLAVDTAGAFLLAGHAFGLLGRVEAGPDPAAEAELRVVAPLAKLATGRLAVAAASELLECFGGAGYVEDTGLPRLLRDAQVLPIWEGTTNVLALDVLRALARDAAGAGAALAARWEEGAERHGGAVGTALTAAARQLREVREQLAAARPPERPATAGDAAAAYPDRLVAGARGLALRFAAAHAAALLASTGGELAGAAAGLWTRRWLAGEDIAADAGEYAETL